MEAYLQTALRRQPLSNIRQLAKKRERRGSHGISRGVPVPKGISHVALSKKLNAPNAPKAIVDYTPRESIILLPFHPVSMPNGSVVEVKIGYQYCFLAHGVELK
jgi:hypothetical protein